MKPNRNDPCPCGSGKKYKHCCERNSVAEKSTVALPTTAELNQLIGLFNAGQLEEVGRRSRCITEQFVNVPPAWKLLGACLHRQGKGWEALPALLKSVELLPKDAEAYYNLGVTQEALGQLEDAVKSYQKALRLNSNLVAAHNNLGYSLQKLGQFDGAIQNYRRALKIKPDYAGAYHNLANAFRDTGKLEDAIAMCRRALEFSPTFAEARSNLLFSLNYTASHTTELCLAEARQYGQMVSVDVTSKITAWQCTKEPERLRVGVVSGDLRHHPVGYALKNLLGHIDSSRIELIAYPTVQVVDDFTTLIKPHFADWKPLSGLSNAESARLIHSDKIHILLDIAGHTGFNGLPIFAWKPAPVQATWLGYFATTGVAEIDYLLTTEAAVPKEHQKHFTETIWYFPDTWLCFDPPDATLLPTPLPALKNNYLTFGCFQRLDKISDAVIHAWSNIFSALPNARLKLACKQLGDSVVVAQFGHRLRESGFDLSRVEMQGPAKTRELFLTRYADVDIMLDTFPYSGVTTTCESLWMGVPTITLAGNTLLSRQGVGVLTAANMLDWIARDEDDYVAKAIQFAGDLPKLAALRAGLREQVLASPLFNASRFAKHFEEALWGMWQAKQPALVGALQSPPSPSSSRQAHPA
ncbi:MAG: tetratricopeptide repeat protein [Gallionella sp.]